MRKGRIAKDSIFQMRFMLQYNWEKALHGISASTAALFDMFLSVSWSYPPATIIKASS